MYLYITNFILVVFFSSWGVLYAQTATEAGKGVAKNVVIIEINGTINPSTTDYIRAGMREAEESGSEALLISLDTPGGLLNSTKDIVKLLLNSDIPVIVYVYPKGATATSAGVFITLAGNIAAMAPGTSIGAAHPVSIKGKNTRTRKNPFEKDEPAETDKEDKESVDVIGEKLENFAISFIQSIAEERGRNVEWAKEAVRSSDSITAREALQKNVIDIISPNISSLLNEVSGREVKVSDEKIVLNTKGAEQKKFEMTLKQKIINILSTPDIAFLLLSLGSLGIIIEFYNPGTIFPGVAGLISLLIGFVSLQILPFNYAGLALVFIGLALFAAELYITSYGLLSLAGFISFIFGSLLLFDTNESNLRVGYEVIIATSLALGLFFVLVVYSVSKTLKLRTMSGFEGLVGQYGNVVAWDGTSGKVYINGEYWDAYSDVVLNVGDKIKVVESKGNLNIKISRI